MRVHQPGRNPSGIITRFLKLGSIVMTAGFIILAVGITEAQTVSAISSFNVNGLSAYPQYVTLAQGRDGNLYGTGQGSNLDFGSIFKLQTTGATSTLYSLDGTQGVSPYAGVTLASDGNFYGTTGFGGSTNDGVVFRVTAAGVYTVLHNFTGTDGAYPEAPPIQASDGNFYGPSKGLSASTIYKYTPSGNFSTIYQFDGTAGQFVLGALTQGTDGNLYGTAYSGGASGCGTIFKMTRAGVILQYYSFHCGIGGANPVAALLQASDGNFYGTTDAGGTFGVGTIFKMSQKGSVSILYSFGTIRFDGAAPDGGLVEGTDGNLYGVTTVGGNDNIGTVYQITKTGSYKQLYSFVSSLGTYPLGRLMQHTNGEFYGTTNQGGSGGAGSVYTLNMGLAPFITFVRPTGGVGQTAQILGQGFTGTTSVTFNGIAATSFKVFSDTYVTAVVPSGATTGPVVVTTPGGTLTSNKSFKIIGGTASAARAKPTDAKKPN
jgi:uncharacterized repeat protein (TIGR03803 family)